MALVLYFVGRVLDLHNLRHNGEYSAAVPLYQL